MQQQYLIKAYFFNSPVNAGPDGFHELDVARINDSNIKNILEASAALANEFFDHFLPEVEVRADNKSFISPPSIGEVYFSAVLVDGKLQQEHLVQVSRALHSFCCACVEHGEDLFNTKAGAANELESQQSQHEPAVIECEHLVDHHIQMFKEKKKGRKIKDPFSLKFPALPESSEIAGQGSLISLPKIAEELGSYEGVAIPDGGRIEQKCVYLKLVNDKEFNNVAVPCSVDDEDAVRVVCAAAAKPEGRVRVEARYLKEGNQRRWALMKVDLAPDEGPESFDASPLGKGRI